MSNTQNQNATPTMQTLLKVDPFLQLQLCNELSDQLMVRREQLELRSQQWVRDVTEWKTRVRETPQPLPDNLLNEFCRTRDTIIANEMEMKAEMLSIDQSYQYLLKEMEALRTQCSK